jgi:protein TonB
MPPVQTPLPEENQPPEKKEPPEPVPDIETPPPPPPEIEENPDPLEITPRKDLMPKTENLTLSAPEPDEPDPVHPETETPDMPSSDKKDPLPRTTPDQDLSETGKAQAPTAGMTASTDKSPVDTPTVREPSPDLPHRKEAVPLYKENPPPRYPGNARRRGHTGTVLLMVFVSEKGVAEQIRVAASSGYDSLDRAAAKSVADWRFEPGTSGGIPTGMWVKIPITFELKK